MNDGLTMNQLADCVAKLRRLNTITQMRGTHTMSQSGDYFYKNGTDTITVIVKGKGKIKEVSDEIGKFLKELHSFATGKEAEPSYGPSMAGEVIDYTLHYVNGYITKEEWVYTVRDCYLKNNLDMTSLVDFINDHEKEWKQMAKKPHEWFQQYEKITDLKTGKTTLKPSIYPPPNTSEGERYRSGRAEMEMLKEYVKKSVTEDLKKESYDAMTSQIRAEAQVASAIPKDMIGPIPDLSDLSGIKRTDLSETVKRIREKEDEKALGFKEHGTCEPDYHG